LAEKFPAARLWPEDAKARAAARSVCAEMHSGFVALRTQHTMKLRDSYPPRPLREEEQADLQRLSQLWTEMRQELGKGCPYLSRPSRLKLLVTGAAFLAGGALIWLLSSLPSDRVIGIIFASLGAAGLLLHWLRPPPELRIEQDALVVRGKRVAWSDVDVSDL